MKTTKIKDFKQALSGIEARKILPQIKKLTLSCCAKYSEYSLIKNLKKIYIEVFIEN